jgi:hypothetical protein
LGSANCFADPKLGSISSLRCQKSRTRIRKDATCEVMFRGRYVHGLLFRACCSRLSSSISSGGARRDRTDDLMLAKHALSQLSYGPVPEDECLSRSQPRSGLCSRKACRAEAAEQRRLVGLGRLELPTSRLSSARSNQLSYKPLTTRSIAARTGSCQMHRTSAKPLARVRPRRKRNVDGEIPPMQLNNPDDRWPLMFLKRFDRSKLLKNHP